MLSPSAVSAPLLSESSRWELYRVLGEPVRLQLLALAAEEELTIGELAGLVGESQPNISRHTQALRQAGLVSVRKQGTRALVRIQQGVLADAVVKDAVETQETPPPRDSGQEAYAPSRAMRPLRPAALAGRLPWLRLGVW